MAPPKIPLRKKYASDTVRSDTTKRPFITGRTQAEADKRMVDSVRRSKTEAESNKLDSQGKPLDDITLGILRGGSGIKTPPSKKPAPKPKVRPLKMKPLGTDRRGKGRGER